MTPFEKVRSRAVVLPVADIDTDRIIPARFLKVTDRLGLGEHLFTDWPDFPRDAARGARVLVAGPNFGCGSSREHAVWALRDFGFRAVVALSFADIFRNNALKNAVVPVQIDAEAHGRLVKSPGEVTIDLASLRITLPDGTSSSFPLELFSRHCLMEGVDELAYLIAQEADIAAYERRNPDSLRGAPHDV